MRFDPLTSAVCDRIDGFPLGHNVGRFVRRWCKGRPAEVVVAADYQVLSRATMKK